MRDEVALTKGQLEKTAFNPADSDFAIQIFDISQKLAEIWKGSNYDQKRAILKSVSSNLSLTDTSLCVEKTKPFDVLAKGLVLKKWVAEGI